MLTSIRKAALGTLVAVATVVCVPNDSQAGELGPRTGRIVSARNGQSLYDVHVLNGSTLLLVSHTYAIRVDSVDMETGRMTFTAYHHNGVVTRPSFWTRQYYGDMVFPTATDGWMRFTHEYFSGTPRQIRVPTMIEIQFVPG